MDGSYPVAAVEIAVPPPVEALALLPRVDYRDAYRVADGLGRAPEWWMRVFLQDAPAWFRLPWAGAAVGLLGARFGPLPGDATHVAGWRTVHDTPDANAIALDTAAGLHARLIATSSPGHVVISTLIGLDTAYVRRLWPVVRRGHRFFAPYLLARAARSAE